MATVEHPMASTKTLASPHPSVASRRWRFNLETYYRLAEVGILKGGDRVELIDGEIFATSPIGSLHHGCVTCLQYLLTAAIGPRGIVSVQAPVRLDDRSEPEPDLAVLKPRADSYRSAHAGPGDVLLVIEVMDFSADFDRNVKLPLYARSGVPEVWLVDLNREVVETYRRPSGEVYGETGERPRGQGVAPEVFPDVVLGVDAILG